MDAQSRSGSTNVRRWREKKPAALKAAGHNAVILERGDFVDDALNIIRWSGEYILDLDQLKRKRNHFRCISKERFSPPIKRTSARHGVFRRIKAVRLWRVAAIEN